MVGVCKSGTMAVCSAQNVWSRSPNRWNANNVYYRNASGTPNNNNANNSNVRVRPD